MVHKYTDIDISPVLDPYGFMCRTIESMLEKGAQVWTPIWIAPGDEVKKLCLKFRDDPELRQYAHEIGVLNVADDYPEYPHHRDTLWIHAGLNDGPPDWLKPFGERNSICAYVQAIQSLKLLCDLKEHVLVHCHSGVSRSAVVVMLHSAWKWRDGDTVGQMESLKEKYPRANPHPKHELEYEDVLGRFNIERTS